MSRRSANGNGPCVASQPGSGTDRHPTRGDARTGKLGAFLREGLTSRRTFLLTALLAIPGARVLAAFLGTRGRARGEARRDAGLPALKREVWVNGDEMLVSWYRDSDGTLDGPYYQRIERIKRDGYARVDRA